MPPQPPPPPEISVTSYETVPGYRGETLHRRERERSGLTTTCGYASFCLLQEKAHVAGEIQQGRELSARAAFFFCGWWWWECINLTWLDSTRHTRLQEAHFFVGKSTLGVGRSSMSGR